MICKVCPYCDAHLDFGERCDCEGAKKETALLQQKRSQHDVPAISLAEHSLDVKTQEKGWNHVP